ncbi:hypothetical protein LX81_01205 [Palleronia aestuarii]|uniref:Uncharacterized protein n=2 Tax=Palleronia aestuarii TaxID=568105 RepID=A0A2W7P215_9RHOB|nr:hypothetical protein LX81_01205 [Palleronia aestuarii]
MRSRETGADSLAHLIANTLAEARAVSTDLREIIIPILSPVQRTYPQHVARRVAGGRIFDEAFVRDLDALIDDLERHVSNETRVGWQADGNHIRGGYEIISRDAGITRLAPSIGRMREFRDGIMRVLDLAKGFRLAEEIFQP